MEEERVSQWRRLLPQAFFVIVALTVLGGAIFGDYNARTKSEFILPLRQNLLIFSIALTLASLIGIPCLLSKRAPAFSFASALVASVLLMVNGLEIMKLVSSDRSTKELAAAIQAVTPPPSAVITYDVYRQSLPFYLQRPIFFVTDPRALPGSNFTQDYRLIRSADRPMIRPLEAFPQLLKDFEKSESIVLIAKKPNLQALQGYFDQPLSPIFQREGIIALVALARATQF